MITPEQRQQIVSEITKTEANLEWSCVLHPVNAAEQKEQFLSGEIEEPVFEYPVVDIHQPNFPDINVETELDSLYRDRLGMTEAMVMLVQLAGQNDEEFGQLSEVVYPVQDIRHQTSAIKHQTSGTKELKSAQQAADHFVDILKGIGLTDWSVEITPSISARMTVNQYTKVILIRTDAEFTEQQLTELTRHEIGCHVLRAANGQRQSEPLLHVATMRGRLIEEGVAINVESATPEPRIYHRHQAVNFARTHGFRETWQMLVDEGVEPAEAWTHTLRVKRGLKHGASKGAFTKDCVYAQGYEEIKQYLDAGGDIVPLLSAPLHPDEIKLFEDYKVFEIPEWLQTT